MTPDAGAKIEADRRATVEALTGNEKFLLTTHENPDGDALGSLLAMQSALQQIGKDSVMFLDAKEFPLQVEYRFLPLEEVFHEPPADISDRVVVFLDCGNVDRMPVDFLTSGGRMVVNIDHHHDNTCFGDVNLVDRKAACTAQIVWALLDPLGAELTPEIAEALYVGLVTDTGKFMYSNVDMESHRMAGELIAAGVDPGEVSRRLYEHAPIEKLRLLSRALDSISTHRDGRLAIAYISAEDFAATGSDESLSEGVIDLVRTLGGTSVAAVVRDLPGGKGPARKVSLRATDGSVDVSAIARKQGGGGHVRAAGFGTDLELAAIVEFIESEIASSGR